jgi:hypothetical protein
LRGLRACEAGAGMGRIAAARRSVAIGRCRRLTTRPARRRCARCRRIASSFIASAMICAIFMPSRTTVSASSSARRRTIRITATSSHVPSISRTTSHPTTRHRRARCCMAIPTTGAISTSRTASRIICGRIIERTLSTRRPCVGGDDSGVGGARRAPKNESRRCRRLSRLQPSHAQENALGRSADGLVTIWCASRQITSRWPDTVIARTGRPPSSSSHAQ